MQRDMMMKTSWMDANEAFEKGFVDGVTETPAKLPTDSAGNKVSLDTAKAGVQAWLDRKTKPFFYAANAPKHTAARLCGAAQGTCPRTGQPRAGFRHRHTAGTSQILRRSFA